MLAVSPVPAASELGYEDFSQLAAFTSFIHY